VKISFISFGENKQVTQVILLAAGLSNRFGAPNKLLHLIDGKSIFQHTLSNLHQAKLGKIIIVTGLDRDKIIEQIPHYISYQEVFNSSYKSGMTSSIQAAVKASPSHASGYMICLADQIKIKPQTYFSISLAYENLYLANHQTILVPSYQNQNANPVILAANYKEDILQLKTSNGCKPIVLENEQHIHTLAIDDSGLKYDIDTVEDLEEI